MDVGSPLESILGLVEGLPWDGLADSDFEGLAHIFVHLIDEKEHGYIELQLECLADIGNPVEPFRVLSTKVDGYYITVGLHTLADKGLLPGQVFDTALLFAATQSGREHQNVVVGMESSFHHGRKVTTLFARLVDGDGDWSQSWQVHEQVVDKVSEVTIVLTADDSSESDAVNTPERVVADEGVELAIVLVWQVLATFHL